MTDPMPTTIVFAAVRFVEARRAKQAARKAWTNYLDESWGPRPAHHEEPSDRHSYGHCRRDRDGEPRFPLCEVCTGSDPLYQAYRAANTKASTALRSLMRLVPKAAP